MPRIEDLDEPVSLPAGQRQLPEMERIFSASALGKRDKWQTRPDYRERTIDKALEGRTEFYTPG